MRLVMSVTLTLNSANIITNVRPPTAISSPSPTSRLTCAYDLDLEWARKITKTPTVTRLASPVTAIHSVTPRNVIPSDPRYSMLLLLTGATQTGAFSLNSIK